MLQSGVYGTERTDPRPRSSSSNQKCISIQSIISFKGENMSNNECGNSDCLNCSFRNELGTIPVTFKDPEYYSLASSVKLWVLPIKIKMISHDENSLKMFNTTETRTLILEPWNSNRVEMKTFSEYPVKNSNEFLCYSLCMYLPMGPPDTRAKNFVNLHKNLNSISKRKQNFVVVHARLWFSKIKNNC